MGHLVGHVLSTPHSRRINTDLCEEQLCPGEEVTESLVINDALSPLALCRYRYMSSGTYLSDSITNSHFGQIGSTVQLNVLGQE